MSISNFATSGDEKSLMMYNLRGSPFPRYYTVTGWWRGVSNRSTVEPVHGFTRISSTYGHSVKMVLLFRSREDGVLQHQGIVSFWDPQRFCGGSRNDCRTSTSQLCRVHYLLLHPCAWLLEYLCTLIHLFSTSRQQPGTCQHGFDANRSIRRLDLVPQPSSQHFPRPPHICRHTRRKPVVPPILLLLLQSQLR